MRTATLKRISLVAGERKEAHNHSWHCKCWLCVSCPYRTNSFGITALCTCGAGLLGVTIRGAQTCVAVESMKVGSLIWGLSLTLGSWNIGFNLSGAEYTFLWTQTLFSSDSNKQKETRLHMRRKRMNLCKKRPFRGVVVHVVFFTAHQPYNHCSDHQEDGENCTHTSYYPSLTCKHTQGSYIITAAHCNILWCINYLKPRSQQGSRDGNDRSDSFGPGRNISTMTIKYGAGIHGPQRMNCDNFGENGNLCSTLVYDQIFTH